MNQQQTPSERVQQKYPQWIMAVHHFRGQETCLIKREGLLDVARFLYDNPAMAFDFLMDMSAVDYLKFGKVQRSAPTLASPAPLPYFVRSHSSNERWQRLVSNDEYRFDVVYHFFSSHKTHRLRLKVPLSAKDASVISLTGLWASADWFEREIWDMFGIQFAGHPNLKRILMYEGFEGHPLRKDYAVNRRQPLVGPVN